MKEFREPDLSAPRFRPEVYSILNKTFFDSFRNKFPKYKDLENKDLKNIIKSFNEYLYNTVIETRDGVQLPESIGWIFIGTCQTSKKENVDYAILLTTCAGAWRYLIGDTIQFTKLNPYHIIITGRLKHYINAFGEELIIDNSDKAIASASEKTNAIVNDYTAAPIYFSENNNGAHEWLIEFDKDPDDLDKFIFELDDCLKNINSDYEAKRHKNIALRLPIVHKLPRGSFTAWLRSKGKLGGQHKVPRLSNERLVLEEIFAVKNI